MKTKNKICTLCGSSNTVHIGKKLYGCHGCGEEFTPGKPNYRYELFTDTEGVLHTKEVVIPIYRTLTKK